MKYEIYEGGNSKARNPRIQNMLRMIGFGENLGFGFAIVGGRFSVCIFMQFWKGGGLEKFGGDFFEKVATKF